MSDPVSRRAFLAGAAALGGAGALGAWGVLAFLRDEADETSPMPRFDALLADPAVAVALGVWYVTQAPDEARPDWLLEAVFGRGALDDDVASLAAALRERALSDYQEGRTRLVDGWVVSLSELRFCALLYAEASPSGA